MIKLEGGGQRYRRRLGSRRIFFTIDTSAKVVDVSAIARCTSTT